ncbi:Fe-S cluster assembly protein SufD [Rhizobium sp. SSA_523]|uniref:Fe-S cluster assembly protein SufD n=1 Tax=Rhizobium sp. SSA_523 TaxID=2952477 RepID=UPI0020901C84|nr:Fe-S cluster assembly protein SufD [Rhizobium sp. SSA_523]MCO5729934.1 Fe-S cluster assembly protein SufD [Rhizobium sp. SSA_523]WKC25014.1 Fe-S cluster assembly protein SufD [Rhizobium sp. SSA_523]
MNMQTHNRQTAAESALIEAFTQQVGDLPGNGAVISARDRLVEDLKSNGLPSRRVEAWHYTDLKTLLRALPGLEPAGDVTVTPALVEHAKVIATRDGQSDARASINGVLVSAFADMLREGTAAPGLSVIDRDDTIGKINGSFVRDGYVLEVPEGAVLDAPIEIQALHGAGQIHTRFPVSFGRHSTATVIERHLPSGEGQAFVTSVSDISLEDGADVTWIILQEQGAADTHLGQMRVRVGENAKLRLYVINAGGKLVRQELRIDVAGEGSDLQLRGVNLLGGDTHTDVTLVLGHNVPNTTSTEIFRNVVFDRARGVFQGMIKVALDAQKTDARMACNTLLMSDDAEFAAKPELEIFADDVQCGHGATVADIDDNHLYYMMARGIPRSRARAMLVNAFVAEIVEELDDEALVEALEGVISRWLEGHA